MTGSRGGSDRHGEMDKRGKELDRDRQMERQADLLSISSFCKSCRSLSARRARISKMTAKAETSRRPHKTRRHNRHELRPHGRIEKTKTQIGRIENKDTNQHRALQAPLMERSTPLLSLLSRTLGCTCTRYGRRQNAKSIQRERRGKPDGSLAETYTDRAATAQTALESKALPAPA